MIFLRILVIVIVVLSIYIENADSQQTYQISARDLHNSFRPKHKSPLLTLDNALNAAAEQCATYYANKKAIDHTCPYKNGAGENLVGGAGTWTQAQFATMGPQMWYDEVSKYNYSAPGFSSETGHFTQVVWKSSLTFGFGAITINGFTVGVGLYNPPGNYLGQFPQNVLPPA